MADSVLTVSLKILRRPGPIVLWMALVRYFERSKTAAYSSGRSSEYHPTEFAIDGYIYRNGIHILRFSQ